MGRTHTTPRRQRGGVILWTLLAIVLVAGAYYGYKAIVFYRTNVAPAVEQVSAAVNVVSGIAKQAMPSSTVTRDPAQVEAQVQSILSSGLPPGYKGAFALTIQMLGKSARLLAAIPEGAEASQIFEGGTNEIRFNPGPHTIFLVAKSDGSDRDEMRAELAKMAAGSDRAMAFAPVYIDVGPRQVAAYAGTGESYGTRKKGVLVALDDGTLIFAVGPAEGFNEDAWRRFLYGVVAAHPANELLYTHAKAAPVSAPSNDPCGIRGLPDDFDLVLVRVQRGSTPLDIAIDRSGSDVAREDVVVGATPKPVVLVLAGDDPIVWNVGSTADARIAGILAQGARRQAVMGVPKSLPVTAYSGQDGPNACPYFRADRPGDPTVAKRMRELFGRDPGTVLERKGGPAFVVGDVSGEVRHAPDVTLASLALPGNVLPGGQRGIDRLAKDRMIRPAIEQEVEAWLQGAARRKGVPLSEYRREMDWRLRPGTVYVVLDAFDLPEGLGGANARTFIVPAGAPRPGGPQGHCTFLAMEGFECYGTACR